MNNKPVAWINKTGSYGYLEWDKDDEVDESIPLYTHPVKELPTKEDEYWLMVEVLRAKVKEQQAEIERLSNDNYKFIKAMANKDSHIESLKQLLNDSALRKAQEQ